MGELFLDPITFHQSYYEDLLLSKTKILGQYANKMMILLIFWCDCVILLWESHTETILILFPVSLLVVN